MATTRRRIMTTRRATVDIHNALRDEAVRKANALYEREQDLQAAQAAWNVAAEEALKAMQKAKVDEVPMPSGAEVIVYTPQGRKTTIVDPAKFRQKVSDAEFMSCVKVSVTDARTVMSDKALKKVSTEIPAKPGTPVVKVQYPKATKKKA